MESVSQVGVFPSEDLRVAQGPPPQLAIVIPTLHEAGNIRTVLERIRESLDPLNIQYELIVVDDDSRDGTESIVQEVAGEDRRVRLLVRENARGLAGAITHGWRHSRADVLGVIDADLQHPPELLGRMWDAMLLGYDVVIASRYAAPGGMRSWNPVRRMLSRFSTQMAWPFQRPRIRAKDPLSGFFLVRRSCLGGVAVQPQGFKILLEILVKGKIESVAEVPFEFGVRHAGDSKANLSTGWHYVRLLGRLFRERSTTDTAKT